MFFTNLRKQMKWIFIVLVVLFGGSIFFVGGPGLFGGARAEQEALARPVAEVNGRTIGALELQSIYRNNLAVYRQLFGEIRPEQREEILYRSLDSLIRNELMLQAARKERIQPDPDAVNAELDQIKNAFPSEQAFRDQLRAARITERDLREMIGDNLIVRQLEENIRSQVQVTEDDVRADYEAVRVRHILIRPEGDGPDWSEAAWEEARRRALDLREQLLAGADFAQLAEEHSADRASAQRGGDIGFFNRESNIVPEFKDAAFALEVGAISEPVRTRFGYHLIEVTEYRAPEGEAFEEAKAEIEERLRRERGEARLQEWLAARRAEANVTIHDPRLRAYERLQEGDFEGAVADYRLALEEDPFDPYIHVSMSTALDRLGRSAEALAELETAVEKSANDPELLVILGLAYRDAGRADDAKAVLVQASEGADWDPELQFTVAQVLAELGYDEEARAAEERLETILREWAESQRASGGGRIEFSEEDWRSVTADDEDESPADESGEQSGDGGAAESP